jgi:hypothetical protein
MKNTADNVMVDDSFLEPALLLLRDYCRQRRESHGLSDEQFLRSGILRVFGQCDSGRDFLQARADAGHELARATWFDALHSPRRLAMVAEVAGKSEIFGLIRCFNVGAGRLSQLSKIPFRVFAPLLDPGRPPHTWPASLVGGV